MEKDIIMHDITMSLLKNCSSPDEAVKKYFELLPLVEKAIDEHYKNLPLPNLNMEPRFF